MEVGSEFKTLARAGFAGKKSNHGRMSYRLAEVGKDYCKVQLTNSDGNARFFKNADGCFVPNLLRKKQLLTCSVDFVLRLRYVLLAPMFLMMKSAIQKDLRQLKQVLEGN